MTVTHFWTIKDVQGIRPDLDRDQARNVIEAAEQRPDALRGITRTDLATVAGELFPHQPHKQDNLDTPWTLKFGRDGTEDFGVIFDSDGQELVKSRYFWLPDFNDDEVPGTLAALWAMTAAPKLLAACQMVVERWEQGDLAEAARACKAAIEEATQPSALAHLPDSKDYEVWPPGPYIRVE